MLCMLVGMFFRLILLSLCCSLLMWLFIVCFNVLFFGRYLCISLLWLKMCSGVSVM